MRQSRLFIKENRHSCNLHQSGCTALRRHSLECPGVILCNKYTTRSISLTYTGAIARDLITIASGDQYANIYVFGYTCI